MVTMTNATDASMGWSREAIMAGIAKMKAIKATPRDVRMSEATRYEFMRRYMLPLQTVEEIDAMFGLRIVLDESVPFGKYKFE